MNHELRLFRKSTFFCFCHTNRSSPIFSYTPLLGETRLPQAPLSRFPTHPEPAEPHNYYYSLLCWLRSTHVLRNRTRDQKALIHSHTTVWHFFFFSPRGPTNKTKGHCVFLLLLHHQQPPPSAMWFLVARSCCYSSLVSISKQVTKQKRNDTQTLKPPSEDGLNLQSTED